MKNTLAMIPGELTADYRLIEHHVGDRVESDVEPPVPAWGSKPWHAIQDSVVNFERHAVEAFGVQETPRPSGVDNLKTLALALASYESAERGSVISMEGWREDAAALTR